MNFPIGIKQKYFLPEVDNQVKLAASTLITLVIRNVKIKNRFILPKNPAAGRIAPVGISC